MWGHKKNSLENMSYYLAKSTWSLKSGKLMDRKFSTDSQVNHCWVYSSIAKRVNVPKAQNTLQHSFVSLSRLFRACLWPWKTQFQNTFYVADSYKSAHRIELTILPQWNIRTAISPF